MQNTHTGYIEQKDETSHNTLSTKCFVGKKSQMHYVGNFTCSYLYMILDLEKMQILLIVICNGRAS
jgi:hypothetical protein